MAPAALQSWPGIVHGGGLVAILDAATRVLGIPDAARVVEGRLTASVPIATELVLDGRAHEGGASLTVVHEGQTLSSASVSVGPAPDPAPAAWRGGGAGWVLPMSEDCLACGSRNPLGLQTALRFDEDGVWARLTPRMPWLVEPGRTHAALAPVLLDEVAWWLGALTMREGGLTNRIQVTLGAAALPAGAPLLAAGRFTDVEPVDRKRTFWRTRTALLDTEGGVLATANIVFRGGTEYSARQVPYFKLRADATSFSRMFPNYG